MTLRISGESDIGSYGNQTINYVGLIFTLLEAFCSNSTIIFQYCQVNWTIKFNFMIILKILKSGNLYNDEHVCIWQLNVIVPKDL